MISRLNRISLHRIQFWILRLALGLLMTVQGTAERTLQPLLSTPEPTVSAGQSATLLLSLLNPGTLSLQGVFPGKLELELRGPTNILSASAERINSVGMYNIQPQGFGTTAYRFVMPAGFTGDVVVSAGGVPGSSVRFSVTNGVTPPTNEVVAAEPALAPRTAGTTGSTKEPDTLGRQEQRRPDHVGLDSAGEFFRDHFFGYQPMYALMGPDHPNTKLQFSFKYKLIGEDSWLAQQAPWVRGAYFAYTQTSLWDTSAPSAPFLDTSYKPEFLYQWQDIWRRGNFPDWMRFDLDTALGHESNGRDGEASRTLNQAYLRPRVVLGYDGGWQVTVAPRAWVYLGTLNENPEIATYRGYAELQVRVGKFDSILLDAKVRAGNSLIRGSVTLDASYPLRNLTDHWLNGYLYVQYFNGYGESLLKYQERSSTFRIGYGLFR
jgi:phospholipase A1/A2